MFVIGNVAIVRMKLKVIFFTSSNTNDGYDASRILNTSFLNHIQHQCEGEMLVGVPHQDVLILADIRNKTGYDIYGSFDYGILY